MLILAGEWEYALFLHWLALVENFLKLIHSWTINWAASPSQVVTQTKRVLQAIYLHAKRI